MWHLYRMWSLESMISIPYWWPHARISMRLSHDIVSMLFFCSLEGMQRLGQMCLFHIVGHAVLSLTPLQLMQTLNAWAFEVATFYCDQSTKSQMTMQSFKWKSPGLAKSLECWSFPTSCCQVQKKIKFKFMLATNINLKSLSILQFEYRKAGQANYKQIKSASTACLRR